MSGQREEEGLHVLIQREFWFIAKWRKQGSIQRVYCFLGKKGRSEYIFVKKKKKFSRGWREGKSEAGKQESQASWWCLFKQLWFFILYKKRSLRLRDGQQGRVEWDLSSHSLGPWTWAGAQGSRDGMGRAWQCWGKTPPQNSSSSIFVFLT